jgi:pilus assembly protein CpaB
MSLLAAGCLIWVALNVQTGQTGLAPPGVKKVRAPTPQLFAKSDIARGERLTGRNLAVRSVRVEGAKTALSAVSEAEGHMALAPITAGQPVLSSEITREVVSGISSRVPVGYRAYAIPISEADIAGGFLQAGDTVDLYVTLPGALFGSRQTGIDRTNDQSKSTLLLQGVDVLAVGTRQKSRDGADTSARTVTLALHSDDLSKVALAARLGNVSLAIRNPQDVETTQEASADLNMLVVAASGPTGAGKSHRRPTMGIIVYSGHDRSTVRLP